MNVEQFRTQRDHDLARLAPGKAEWISRWECAPDYRLYQGPQELLRWFEWVKPFEGNLAYFPEEMIEPLARRSADKHRAMVERIRPGTEYTFSHIDRYNAQDYLLQNAYPVPERMRPRKVLDFGAGYGRQANLWTQMVPDVVYVAMDAIEHSYGLQNFYFQNLDRPLRDYLDGPNDFRIEDRSAIYHLPTWRDDLLPAGFFDMILCVQVLPELNETLFRHMIHRFAQSLRPGGALYLRDHGDAWLPGHRVDTAALLEEEGFMLEWQPYLVDNLNETLAPPPTVGPDLHGLPRLWRKRDPRYFVPAGVNGHARSRWKETLINIDRAIGGMGRSLYHRLKS